MKCRAHPKACVATYQKYMPTQWRGCPSNRRRVHVSPYAHSQSCALYVHILPLSLHMSLAHLCLGRAQVSWSVVRLVSQLVGWHTGRTQSVSLSSGWSVSRFVGLSRRSPQCGLAQLVLIRGLQLYQCDILLGRA